MLKTHQIITIFIFGILGSLTAMMMIYVALAQIFLDYVLGNIDPDLNIAFLIIGLLFITFISSIIVSFLVVGDISTKSVSLSSLYSYLLTLAILIFVSILSLVKYYPSVFEGLEGFEYFGIIPMSIVYFAIFVLEQFFYLFLITVLIYYIFFVIFLVKLYNPKKLKEAPVRSDLL